RPHAPFGRTALRAIRPDPPAIQCPPPAQSRLSPTFANFGPGVAPHLPRTRPADNRRTVMINITPAGVSLLSKLADDVRECHARQLGHLSASQTKTLV